MEKLLSGSVHTHSEMSGMDGAGKIKHLISKFKELGATKFALTDHGTMTGIFEAWDICEKEGMDFIPGIEAYVKDETSDEIYHLIMLAKNMTGYKALCKIVSCSELNKIKNKPCMNRQMLEEFFGEGTEFHGSVIATSACIQGELPMVFLHNMYAQRDIDKLTVKQADMESPEDEAYKALEASLKQLDDKIAILDSEKSEIESLAKRVYGKKLNAEKKILSSKGKSEEEIANIIKNLELPADYEADEEEIKLFSDIKATDEAKKQLEEIKKEAKNLSKKRTEINKEKKAYESKFAKLEKNQEAIKSIQSSMYDKEIATKKVNDILNFYKKTFEDDFYIEVQNHGMEEEAHAMPRIAIVARQRGIKIVASNDIHMVNKEDVHKRQLIKAKRFNKWEEADVADKELYIKTDAELTDMLAQILPRDVADEAIANIQEILDKCECKREKETHYPKAILPEGKNADDELERLCRSNIPLRYAEGEWDEAHEKRLCYELEVIRKMGFSDYHLIEADIIEAGLLYGYIPTERLAEAPFDKEELKKFCKENDWNVGMGVGVGRGSAAGSIVCYLAQITHIDPLKYDLLFERFLNQERVTMPDIDTDFEPSVRTKLVGYVANKFGEKQTAQIVTKNTAAAKGSIRNCARYLGDKYFKDGQHYAAIADMIAKSIPSKTGIKIADCMDILSEKFSGNKEAMQIINDALLVESYFTNYGQHAAGVIIAPEPIENIVPTMLDDNGGLKTQCDMIVAEKRGMLKFDFLVLKNLTYISNTLKALKKKGIKIDLYNLDFEPEVLKEIYAEGNTTAVFQFESAGIREMLRKFKPNSFEDIILANATYRPGPMDSIPAIIAAKNSGIIECPIPELDPILGKTYGQVVYQEQVMDIFKILAGYSLGQADLVRRAMSKKHLDEVLAEKEAFLHGDVARNIDGCEKRGIDLDEAEKLFSKIEAFAEYAFNKSHAAVYSYVSYITAYLKYHYPAEFLAEVMAEADLSKLPLLIRECERCKIKVLPPSINDSDDVFTVVSDSEIRFGLSTIKSIGHIGTEIVEERKKNGPFSSVKDFLRRCNVGKLDALVKAGAFDNFTESRKALLGVINELKDAVKRVKNAENAVETASSVMEAINRGEEIKRMTAGKAYEKLCNEKAKLESELLSLNSLYIPLIPDDRDELLKAEHEYLGTYVTGHPMDNYLTSNTVIDELIPSKSKEDTREIVGVVTDTRIVARKKDGRGMCFFTLEDKTGLIDAVCFVNEYEKYKDFLVDGEVVKVKAICEADYEETDSDEDAEEKLKLIVKSISVAEKVKDTVCVAIPSIIMWEELKSNISKYYASSGSKLVIYDEELGEFRTFKKPVYVSDAIFSDESLKVRKINV